MKKYQNVPEIVGMHFMSQLACAFAYLHNHQIIHRDLKPDNILIKSECPLWIKLAGMFLLSFPFPFFLIYIFMYFFLDFGFSREYQENDLSQSRCGSLLYEVLFFFLNLFRLLN